MHPIIGPSHQSVDRFDSYAREAEAALTAAGSTSFFFGALKC